MVDKKCMNQLMVNRDDVINSVKDFIMDMSSKGIVVNDLNKLMNYCEHIADAGNKNPLDILMYIVKTGEKRDIHFYAGNKVISELKSGEYDFYLKSVYGVTHCQVAAFVNSVGEVYGGIMMLAEKINPDTDLYIVCGFRSVYLLCNK